MKSVTVIFMLVVGLTANLYAQQPEKEKNTAKEKSEILNTFIEEERRKERAEPGKPVLPEGLSIERLDEPTKAQYFTALRAYFGYRISGYQHRKAVFKWQLYSSVVIFIVVIALVSVGIYFSWIQFNRSFVREHTAGSTETEKITQVKATIQGIEVSSPVLGVIILIISLLFFYLYLVYVYPIEEIF